MAATVAVALATAPPVGADPTPANCHDPSCVPGIAGGVVLGAPCTNTAYYVFGTAVAGASTVAGRLVFCGSPRRYAPRYFRSPSMAGIKELNTNCLGYENWVAQAPDGLFLNCQSQNGQPLWGRGDA